MSICNCSDKNFVVVKCLTTSKGRKELSIALWVVSVRNVGRKRLDTFEIGFLLDSLCEDLRNPFNNVIQRTSYDQNLF